MIKYSLKDKITNTVTLASAILFLIFVLSLIGSLAWNSRDSIKKFGFSFITDNIWNVKFFELSHVQLQHHSLRIFFTTPPNPKNNFTNLISVSLNKTLVPFTYSLQNNYLTIYPTKFTMGTYSIIFAPQLEDIYNKSFQQEIIWHGLINHSNNQIQNVSITGSRSGQIQSIIQDENERQFGLLPFIIGTILSSILALFLAFPIALSVALFLTEYAHKHSSITSIFSILIDLLAGIPSVVYGLWGLFYIVPKMGANLATASLILAIMTIPYAVSLSKEAILLVPKKLKEASYALGASKYKTISKVILPYAQSGIIASILLSLGRALGETLAVTMVIGNRNQIPHGLFQPAQTIASLIANEYGEASGLKQSALIQAGLVLIIITLIFSLLGQFIIKTTNRTKGRDNE